MVRIFLPLSFLLIGYGLIFALAQPYLRPMLSIYDLIAQNQTPDFSDKAKNLYEGKEGLPTSGMIDASTITKPKVLDTYGRIEIPEVSIDVPLLYGSTMECLYRGVGQRVQSSMPGYGKPVMLAGHTIPFFKNLGSIKKGDVVKIETFYGIFEYQVKRTQVASASDPSVYNLTQNKEELIMFTCYPLDGIGQKEDRLFVFADKISGPEVVVSDDE